MATKHHKAEKLAAAALTLAGKHGWDSITSAQLAKAARVSAGDAVAFLADPTPCMRAIADYVTDAAHRDYRHDSRNSPREALFEILMLRLDVLQTHRAGFLALQEAARRKPPLAAAILQAFLAQTDVILRAAHIDAGAPRLIALRVGLGLIYGATLCRWRDDTSPDLAKTMATLDRQLDRAESLMRFLDHTKSNS